ncbi:MAG: NADH-quinone oxidoreductase subunit J [OCS116 cluster bacterium]|uniref:NADH-quinone oxidoreductase subunit J n=1 Tax=OCS116 cluster bacterium TaxID=2030921 RepID=A0A2A4Z5S7_9PROT|nr:NADH-quinone oxidoreductase subunit J [OCS116 cluster bacterium]
MIAGIFFYIFAIFLIASAIMVISSRNPVYAVFFLILGFFNATGLFILLGAEFLAMLLLMVYVGAVMVLFLFVVMMIDIDFKELSKGFLQYAPVGTLIGVIILAEIIMVVGGFVYDAEMISNAPVPIPDVATVSNLEAFGLLLYGDYVFFIEMAGIILLIALIGAVVLTLKNSSKALRQDIATQVARTPETAIEMVSVKSGQAFSTKDTIKMNKRR